ncbi:MAG: hypothetical protein JF607_00575 [Burkholderiales bacterium]|jgi:hypothetical protein|nr:hypothetical protein [Burkholderiales bacterium]
MHRLLRTLAGLLATGALCAAASAQTPTAPPPDCTPLPATATRHDVAYQDYLGTSGSITFWQRDKVCYGDGVNWLEGPSGVYLTERASVYTATDPATDPPGTRRPLLIFTHPSGNDEQFRYADSSVPADNPYSNSVLFQSVMAQALKAGYTVVSLEFRHPLTSYVKPGNTQPGNTDIRDAVQYLKFKADSFHIDPNNVFLVGQSRGSLNMLWAIKDNAATVDPQRPWRAMSSKVNAVWDYQAQTCYDRQVVMQNFILPDSYADFLSDSKFPEPAGYVAGCAMGAVIKAEAPPPIQLMYDEEPVAITAPTLQHYCSTDWKSKGGDAYCWNKLHWHDDQHIWNTWFDEHDANFGVALVGAAGSGTQIQACYGVAVKYDDPKASGPWNGYHGLVDFLDQHQSPPVVRSYPPFQCPVVKHKPPQYDHDDPPQ